MANEREHRLNGRIVQALTIDFWGTIAHDTTYEQRRAVRIDRVHAWLEGHGVSVPRETVQQELATFSERWKEEWEKRQHTPGAMDCVQHMVAAFDVEADEAARQELAVGIDRAMMDAPPVLIDGARESLEALAGEFSLALVSDTGLSGSRSIRELLETWNLESLFSAFAFSDEVGISKPNPRMFYTALQGLGMPQHRAVHIGDLDQTDIIGAKNLGMGAIRFDGARKKSECKKCSMADRVVSSWQEIVEALLAGDEEEDRLKVHVR